MSSTTVRFPRSSIGIDQIIINNSPFLLLLLLLDSNVIKN